MKHEISKKLNERPISFKPLYVDLTGSVTAGLYLSQLMYWFSKKDKFYKTDVDLATETRLTPKELVAAKKKIKLLPFLEITREGIPSRTNYKIDWDLYEKALEEVAL